LIAGKEYANYDAVTRAKINKLTQRGSGASDALRRMSIMLAHADRQASLGLKEREFQFTQLKGWREASKQADDDIKALEEEYRNLAVTAGGSMDMAQGGKRGAALQGMQAIGAQIQAMKQQRDMLKRGDINGANMSLAPMMGGNFTPASQLDATSMYSDFERQRQEQLLRSQYPQAQQSPQIVMPPQQAAPSINFNPTIVTGGGPGMAGGAGAGAPITGGGGYYGGPGVMGGGGIGGGPQPPGGGGGAVKPTGKPAS
jgi:hypothetical protein